MYNQNNMWPQITPLSAFGFTQPLNSMPNNSNILPQNINHLSPYYNPNQNFGQHFNSNYNYYGSPLIPQTNQSMVSPYNMHQMRQTFATNASNQSYVTPHQKEVRTPTLTTIQTIDQNNRNLNQSNENNEWLHLLNASQKQVLDQLNQQTQAFEQQFTNWEKDFENWKNTNRSHPDSSAYQLYSNQWQEWRQKLIERQQQMKDLRNRTLQQLYSQISPQLTQKVSKPPPPPPPIVSQTQPPLPAERKALPPPPPPPSESFGQRLDSFKRSENNRNENNREIQTNEQNSKNQSKDEIEIIEIDCEPKTSAQNLSEDKSVTCADPSAVSKAAEALLFIQKQQELLKSLDSFKNIQTIDKTTNKSSDEPEIIEPKPFDMKDIVSKMKAIRPPENATEANKLLSTLPSLQGIVFQPKTNQINESKQQMVSNTQPIDRSFSNSFGHSFTQNNNNNNNNNNNRNPFPHSVRPQVSDNRWTSPNPGSSREGQHFHRNNDNPSPLQTLQTNTVRKYSAQTIDYNHRHENRDFDQRIETSAEVRHYFPANRIPIPLNSNNFDQTIDSNHSFNREVFEDMRKPMNNNLKTREMASIEEPINYRDIRYFTQPKSRIVPIDDLFRPPTREFRPENIVIILRGLPGSGKTFIAKLIKEKEMEFGKSAPRILSIDDYFMSEVERQTKVPETGKIVKSKEYVYEYENEMESCYRASLLKTYKKTVDDRLFPFIIIDAVNELIADIEDFYSYAIKNDFVVYVIEMVSTDPLVCHKNNVHNRTLEDIKMTHKKWQTLPEFMLKLDIRSLLQNASIKNIEMDVNPIETEVNLKRKAESEPQTSNKELKSFDDSEEQSFNGETRVSRWEQMEASESKLDKLDSFRMKTKQTIEEYLQVPDDYDLRVKDKQKRVRWADIEHQKKQEQVRQRGFVVGLDWHQYMDPQQPQRVLTETKYF